MKAMNYAGKFPQLNYKITELEHLMDKPALKEGSAKFSGVNRDVQFENVRFAYGEKEILHGVSLELKQGNDNRSGGRIGKRKIYTGYFF